jgi:hypothetical protein
LRTYLLNVESRGIEDIYIFLLSTWDQCRRKAFQPIDSFALPIVFVLPGIIKESRSIEDIYILLLTTGMNVYLLDIFVESYI